MAATSTYDFMINPVDARDQSKDLPVMTRLLSQSVTPNLLGMIGIMIVAIVILALECIRLRKKERDRKRGNDA